MTQYQARSGNPSPEGTYRCGRLTSGRGKPYPYKRAYLNGIAPKPVFDTPQQVGESAVGVLNLLGVFRQESGFQNV